MKLQYGYVGGHFSLVVTDDEPHSPRVLQRITLTRKESAQVGYLIKFGRIGQTKTIDDHKQTLVLHNNLATEAEIKEQEICGLKCPNCEPACICHRSPSHDGWAPCDWSCA